ncbi:hypothetical protein [Indioceanicola profundi]|uniref:hypothetical protein n=1 Tax=Indioceanicola profundi TaxID=2220096 RepID=UPI000E6AB74C|nr:hypothetical protein [Indioceanicola profundi]
MPFPIKVALSIFVLITMVAAYFFQDYLGQTGPKYAVLFLGIFMTVALWVFPEVTRDAKKDKQK